MKTILPLMLAAVILCSACRKKPVDCNSLVTRLDREFAAGNLSRTAEIADSIEKFCAAEPSVRRKADSLKQIAGRILIDFPLTETMFDQQLRERRATFTPEEKVFWDESGWLEWKIIDGEKRYFRRSAGNLDLIIKFRQNRPLYDSLEGSDPDLIFRLDHTKDIIRAAGKYGELSVPASVTLNYTITVDADVVPPGELIRCWMPYPRENHLRQQNVVLLFASPDDYLISPDTMIHRSVYMESASVKGVPTVFKLSFSYESAGIWFDPRFMTTDPYNTQSDFYRRYTTEQLPHIVFSDNVKALTDSITGDLNDPAGIVKSIYYWICENILWTGAQEYSIIPCIPEYVIKHKRGDCGMQTFLLMSMLRYKGIPVRWQSGWMVPPGAENLHDWCEVYYEGTGWVPLDISYGLQHSEDRKIREFFITGIDAYRLIINDGVAGELFPEKTHLRSEPYDFQRGEVEWSGGNLYFDKWDYTMQIEYLK